MKLPMHVAPQERANPSRGHVQRPRGRNVTYCRKRRKAHITTV